MSQKIQDEGIVNCCLNMNVAMINARNEKPIKYNPKVIGVMPRLSKCFCIRVIAVKKNNEARANKNHAAITSLKRISLRSLLKQVL